MKRTTLIFSILLSLFLFGTAKTQTVLLKEDVAAKDTIKKSNKGPNLKNYYHAYFGIGALCGSSAPSAEIMLGYSANWQFGFRYKRKLNKWYALGYDVCYDYKNYRMKTAALGPASDIAKLKFRSTSKNLQATLFNRFNIGKRGNRIGNFLDFGAYGELAFLNTELLISKIKKPNDTGYSRSLSKYSGLRNRNFYNYGAMMRIGFNRYSFFCYYRLSDMFKDFKSLLKSDELPRLSIGLQIGLHS